QLRRRGLELPAGAPGEGCRQGPGGARPAGRAVLPPQRDPLGGGGVGAAVKFGILLDHQYRSGDDINRRTGELVEFTQHIRDLGYDSLFGIHHYLSSLSTPQPLPLLSRLIDHSGTMQIGTGILILPLGHPVHWAEEIATIDQMSGGRFVIGVGAGYRENELAALGIDLSTRVARMYE